MSSGKIDNEATKILTYVRLSYKHLLANDSTQQVFDQANET